MHGVSETLFCKLNLSMICYPCVSFTSDQTLKHCCKNFFEVTEETKLSMLFPIFSDNTNLLQVSHQGGEM